MTAVISGIKTTPVLVPFRRPPITASGAVNEPVSYTHLTLPTKA